MKKIIAIVIIAVVVTVAAAVSGIGIANLVHSSSNNQAGFIGNIPGITDQDKALCRSAWKNGGRYFTRIYDATLDCSRNHISVDFDHQSED